MKQLIVISLFLCINTLYTQDFQPQITSYLNSNFEKHDLEIQDVQNTKIISQTYSESLKVTNVYVNQQFQNIEIYNSTSSFAIRDNSVIKANLSFVKQINSKINSTIPVITASSVINKATLILNITTNTNSELIQTISDNSFIYKNDGLSTENIPVKLVYQRTNNNTLRLAWHMSIYLLDQSHYYSLRIDAITGELLENNDLVISCDFGERPNNEHLKKPFNFDLENQKLLPTIMGQQYNVFPFPIESPSHGSNQLVVNPSNLDASPFGWHDINGVNGAEFTITRGNNVFAKEDRNANNGFGNSPDGGAELNFDFPYDFDNTVENMLDATTVNLFYWNNIMHDVWYQYGFDEQSGNFQENNYGNSGFGGDSVNADAQDGFAFNNANFSTPPEGQNPRMQMFQYIVNQVTTPVEILTINNGSLTGTVTGIPARFGGEIPNTITQDLVLLADNNAGTSNDTNDACDPITNGVLLNGKIVVIRRGLCEFGFKTLAAQNQGAAAIIIVNNVPDAIFPMGIGDHGNQVRIPIIMVTDVIGEAIIAQLNNGNTINATIFGDNVTQRLDSGLDNGIISHEYGHGISNRLTGGGFNTSCLFNDEQMGEGWSDWFGRMLMIQEGDLPEDPKGIGTYVSLQPNDGQGIRNAAYSTDFSINNFTYGATNNTTDISRPHGIGFVWATMLWDLNWALINQYGFDQDLYNGTGGNNIAMQLVIDGLKLQPCNPGFVDARDAIILADQLANNGDNFCLIWNVFANRGLGFSANQGSSFNRTDQTEAFDLPTTPNCTLAINESELNNFNIYPNPAKNIINIKSQIDFGNSTITIYSINGKELIKKEVKLQNTISINIKNLTAGIYIIKITNKTSNYRSKLIIE